MAASMRRLAADGATPVSQMTWETVLSDLAEEIKGPFKFTLENNGTRTLGASPFSGLALSIEQVGTNDGYLYYEIAPDGNGTISKPWGVEVAVGGSGGSFGSVGSYGYKVTALNGAGETIGSREVVAVITSTSQLATLTWETVPTATSYRVYRTAVNALGTYGATSLRATVTAPDVTYEDDGGSLSSGTPPLVNTTGGAGPTYGTAPDPGEFGNADLVIGELEIEQQYFYWARLVVPPGTTEAGNRRVLRLVPLEV